jgi:hypothetical protein
MSKGKAPTPGNARADKKNPRADVAEVARQAMARAMTADLSKFELRVFIAVTHFTSTWGKTTDDVYSQVIAAFVYQVERAADWQARKVRKALRGLAEKGVTGYVPARGHGNRSRVSLTPNTKGPQTKAPRSSPLSRDKGASNAPTKGPRSRPPTRSTRERSTRDKTLVSYEDSTQTRTVYSSKDSPQSEAPLERDDARGDEETSEQTTAASDPERSPEKVNGGSKGNERRGAPVRSRADERARVERGLEGARSELGGERFDRLHGRLSRLFSKRAADEALAGWHDFSEAGLSRLWKSLRNRKGGLRRRVVSECQS